MSILSLNLEKDPALKDLLHQEVVRNLIPTSSSPLACTFNSEIASSPMDSTINEKMSSPKEVLEMETTKIAEVADPTPINDDVRGAHADVMRGAHADVIQKEVKDSELNVWYRVPVAGDGGCMFTSARLGWELIAVMQSIEKNEEINNFILDGNNQVAIRGGFLVRQRICEWYKSGLTKSVPSMGKYTETEGGRDWCRGDLLAMEMVQRETEVPEEGVERTKAQIKYLLHMMLPKTWGGTPEYFAFAQIFKLRIVIYVPGFPDRSKLVMRDCIEPGTVSCPIPINLLFLPSQRHYELLLSREQYESIVSKVGAVRVANIRKIA
jgi:hypothetical protein